MKLLVLTDFSDKATHAALYAARFADQLGVEKIILYHSFEITSLASEIPLPSEEDVLDLHEESLKKLHQLKETLKSELGAKTEVEIQTNEKPLLPAVSAIVNEEDVGLVVIGITQPGTTEKILFNHYTLTLSRECPAPLLAVPETAGYKSVKNIAFACDFKNIVESVPVMMIKKFINLLKARLFVLNVDMNESPDPDLLQKEAKLCHLLHPEKALFYYLDNDDISEGLFNFIRTHRIDLLITVLREYPFMQNIFHKSISKKLLFHSHIPLLILKEPLRQTFKVK